MDSHHEGATASSGVISWPPRDAAHLLVDGDGMAALEQALFDSGLPVPALMEKAALQVAERIRRRLPPGESVLVLVGPGHNGGDGLVVARELHLAGAAVRLWSPFERHKPLTEAHGRHARWLGIPSLSMAPDPDDAALWIDALFGIGQNRPLEAGLESLLEQRRQRRPGRLLAIDVPSGLCANSGRLLGRTAACAERTYCLGLIKQGLVQDSALAWVGKLERLDLGLPMPLLAALPGSTPLGLGAADCRTPPWPALDPALGKFGRGRLLAICGSDSYRGAAHLALAGAGASGVGSLRAALPQAVAAGLWTVLPEVVISARLASGSAGELQLAELPEAALERLDAVLVGPGLGMRRPAGQGSGQLADGEAEPGEAAEQEIWERLRSFGGLLLLDADGLNRCSAAWLRQRQGPTWITPHAGEFARLWPDLADQAPLRAAATAAERCGVSVLLKGARSVVAAADGRRWQLLEARPESARAGLGDVLAGYAAGRGAMAMAACGKADAALLAAAALDHALAGAKAPLRVAARLQSGRVRAGAPSHQM